MTATDRWSMLEAASLVVGLFAAAIASWSMSHRPDWWQVRTELRGFLRFVAAVVLFFAFNLLAYSYLPGTQFVWFLLSFVAFGWFSFRIHEEFDSAANGAEGAANANPSSVLAVVRRGYRWLFGREGKQRSAVGIHLKRRRRSPIDEIIDPQCRMTGRGEDRQGVPWRQPSRPREPIVTTRSRDWVSADHKGGPVRGLGGLGHWP